MERGQIVTLEKLMDRVIGKPKEQIEQSIDVTAHHNTELSNEELFAKAKLIMERKQDVITTGTTENRMEPTGNSTGGDSNSTRPALTVRARNQAEDGEDQ
jgi:hypothetical protein